MEQSTQTFADKVLAFNSQLTFPGSLPAGIRMMNPFRENGSVMDLATAFYRKFYEDQRPRHLILGINPGRFGGGVTGIPFTDTKRLTEQCGIPYSGPSTHEPSSVFVYDVITAYGGPARFYADFYINSICPLGFTKYGPDGKEVNYNYYDSKALQAAVYDFMVASLRRQVDFGVHRDVCFSLGLRNAGFIEKINAQFGFFQKIVPLEHPRFVMQYQSKRKQEYVDKYLLALSQSQ
ncbi:MAG: uracil-DNA glycosylase family protein [Saprospiraceae bacterium]